MEETTPHQIAAALRTEGSDLSLDIERALNFLPQAQQDLLSLYAEGYSPREAAKKLGLKDNPTRLYRRALSALVSIINER